MPNNLPRLSGIFLLIKRDSIGNAQERTKLLVYNQKLYASILLPTLFGGINCDRLGTTIARITSSVPFNAFVIKIFDHGFGTFAREVDIVIRVSDGVGMTSDFNYHGGVILKKSEKLIEFHIRTGQKL